MTGRRSTRRSVVSIEVFSHSNSDQTRPVRVDLMHPMFGQHSVFLCTCVMVTSAYITPSPDAGQSRPIVCVRAISESDRTRRSKTRQCSVWSPRSQPCAHHSLASAFGRCVTSVRSVFLSEKHFRDIATFSTFAQIC
jgi:hypothetical protein